MALCFDGQHLYGSGADMQALYIVDRTTGELQFVAEWEFVEIPEGFQPHHFGGYQNIESGVVADWAPMISGLAFDGQEMYAIESFTQALYRVERR